MKFYVNVNLNICEIDMYIIIAHPFINKEEVVAVEVSVEEVLLHQLLAKRKERVDKLGVGLKPVVHSSLDSNSTNVLGNFFGAIS